MDYLVLWLGQKVSGNSWILSRTEFFVIVLLKQGIYAFPFGIILVKSKMLSLIPLKMSAAFSG